MPGRVRRSLLSFPLQARLCCRGEGAGPIALFENVRFAWRPFPYTSTLCRERRKIVSRVPECERVRRHAHVTFHYPQDLRVLHARGGPLPPAEHAPEDEAPQRGAAQLHERAAVPVQHRAEDRHPLGVLHLAGGREKGRAVLSLELVPALVSRRSWLAAGGRLGRPIVVELPVGTRLRKKGKCTTTNMFWG